MSKRRVDITDMLDEAAAAPGNDARPEPRRRSADTQAPRTSTRTTRPAVDAKSSKRTETTSAPKWTQLEPRTIHLWPESVDEINNLARRLQRSKSAGVGERITSATLVRVAVARLLEEADGLEGVNESELLDSFRSLTTK